MVAAVLYVDKVERISGKGHRTAVVWQAGVNCTSLSFVSVFTDVQKGGNSE